MAEIIFTDTALSDLKAIFDYIALDSPRYAAEFTDKVFERVEILHQYSAAGRVVPEFEIENIRELILGSYRIVYSLESEELIAILRVIHGAKLLKL